MNIVELAEKIATEAHENQKRRDGITPYITHPIEVRNRVKEWLDYYSKDVINFSKDKYSIYKILTSRDYDNFIGDIGLNTFADLAEALSFLHDTVEDQGVNFGYPYIIKQLKENDIPRNQITILIEALEVITKERDEDYLPYIISVKGNPLARLVKIADITHNISTRTGANTAGDIKKDKIAIDKYQLAKYILLN